MNGKRYIVFKTLSTTTLQIDDDISDEDLAQLLRDGVKSDALYVDDYITNSSNIEANKLNVSEIELPINHNDFELEYVMPNDFVLEGPTVKLYNENDIVIWDNEDLKYPF